MSDVQILKNISVVSADFKIWTGQVKLRADDVQLGDGGQLPPEKIAMLGQKKIFDPSRLSCFSKLKTEANRYLASFGIPFLNGFAIPAGRENDVLRDLEQIKRNFYSEKEKLLTSYNQDVEAWILENPGYEDIIRKGVLSLENVKNRIEFEFNIFKVTGTENDASHRKMEAKVAGLGEDLFSEVVRDAGLFYDKNLSGKTEVHKTSKRTIIKIRDKVAGLVFLNGKLRVLLNLLDEVIAAYDRASGKKKGSNLGGENFAKVNSIISILADSDKIQAYCESCQVSSEQDADEEKSDPEVSPLEPAAEIQQPTQVENDIALDFEKFVAEATDSQKEEVTPKPDAQDSYLHKMHIVQPDEAAQPDLPGFFF
ncbi:DUF3150 domain-containing protein [Pseudovibrio sp. Ad37]|uniref:DUF3150 domain-containing protein n=1 Tax=Pseudovibrio sp. Ad37 TaxID=989422 RepID=UPI0007B1CD60|nr:DUF3150 domain-containing protein [Pseudovibrio sp. Ad37]KZL22669.1 hypothetical protein PsAD37_03317 [Pseudovibrio sp. Ad37]